MRKACASANAARLALVAILLSGCAANHREAQGIAIPDGPRGDVLTAALGQLGTRYEYGASSPGRALDCSALTHHAYHSAGLEIPRMSRAQHRAAKPVPRSRLEPGDLVFFRTPGGYHVGILVDKLRFIHASTSARRVKISSLAAPYWRTRLAGAGTFMR
jgi:cell wall-associated NlpC family hydrolase